MEHVTPHAMPLNPLAPVWVPRKAPGSLGHQPVNSLALPPREGESHGRPSPAASRRSPRSRQVRGNRAEDSSIPPKPLSTPLAAIIPRQVAPHPPPPTPSFTAAADRRETTSAIEPPFQAVLARGILHNTSCPTRLPNLAAQTTSVPPTAVTTPTAVKAAKPQAIAISARPRQPASNDQERRERATAARMRGGEAGELPVRDSSKLRGVRLSRELQPPVVPGNHPHATPRGLAAAAACTARRGSQAYSVFMHRVFEQVIATGVPNYKGAKIMLPTNLNISKWENAVSDYHDKEVLEYLKYGFPVGYRGPVPTSQPGNHASARQFPEDVQRYTRVEVEKGAMLGPFPSPPFQPWSHTSPLMTRPKKNTSERRVIVDLSWPQQPGHSVNAGTPIDTRTPRTSCTSLQPWTSPTGCAQQASTATASASTFPAPTASCR